MTSTKEKYKILIVDDTPENIDVLANLLKPHYRLSVALNGPKALKIAFSDTPPDLVLLDIMMPEMDGYDVCRHIKEKEDARDIPVIFVTAKNEVEDEAKGFEVGAVDYITKPVSPPIVLARVRTHLALRQARRTLEAQNHDLIEAAKLREDVDRIMRHDLKGPLTSIIGYPQSMLASPDLDPKYRQPLKSIEESGYMMLNMINLSLDLFKMERGTYVFDPHPVDLVKTFTKILRGQEISTAAKNLKMELFIEGRPVSDTDTFPVMAEELLAFSLFSNLVKNAVEASPEGGPIRVSLDRYSGTAKIRIFNHGVVPEEIRDRFFDKYATAGKQGGTGLGTYSARLMAETMNGSIRLETADPDGTTITIRLAEAESIEASGSEVRAEHTDLKNMRVLVVDDDSHARELILRWLNHPSLTVESAADGREAVDRFESGEYDFLFMDVEMPVMGGLEAVMLIRAFESQTGSGPVPAIALTGHDSAAVREKLLAAGFSGCLAKPVTGKDLVAALQSPADIPVQNAPVEAPPLETEGDLVQVDSDFQGLVEDFIEDNRNTLAELLSAPEDDIVTIARVGHTLAGTGRMYGLARLGQMGKDLETAAKQEPPGDLRTMMFELSDYLKRVRIDFVEED